MSKKRPSSSREKEILATFVHVLSSWDKYPCYTKRFIQKHMLTEYKLRGVNPPNVDLMEYIDAFINNSRRDPDLYGFYVFWKGRGAFDRYVLVRPGNNLTEEMRRHVRAGSTARADEKLTRLRNDVIECSMESDLAVDLREKRFLLHKRSTAMHFIEILVTEKEWIDAQRR